MMVLVFMSNINILSNIEVPHMAPMNTMRIYNLNISLIN
jgi:hypothetical protein